MAVVPEIGIHAEHTHPGATARGLHHPPDAACPTMIRWKCTSRRHGRGRASRIRGTMKAAPALFAEVSTDGKNWTTLPITILT